MQQLTVICKEHRKKFRFAFYTSLKCILLSLFVCFISTNNYKNKAIQRRGVAANGAMALLSGPVCQQTTKSRKENIYNKSSRCCL